MPRVISLFQGKSFQQQFPDITILKNGTRDYFVEMQCYSLAIPADTHIRKEIDIFSDTVLQLIALDRGLTAAQIAERMCVEKDFVQFICIHLQDAGLVNDRYRLTEQGKSQVGQPSAESSADPYDDPLKAYAFALPGKREYLSYLRVGDLEADQATEKWDGKKRRIQFEVGTAGQERAISGVLLRTPGEGKVPLMYGDFPPVIRRYNRICAGNDKFQRIPYRNGYNVEAADEGTVLLHCKAIIQKGNVDSILFSDGFSPHCVGLYQAVSEANPWLKESLLKRAASTRTETTENDGKGREEQLSARQRITKTLQRIQDELLENQQKKDMDVDSSREDAQQSSRMARELCTAVETALYEFVRQHPLPDWERAYLPQVNHAKIVEWAKEIGMEQAERYGKLFRWPRGTGRLQQFLAFDQTSDPEMTLGLCMAVMVEKGYGSTEFSRLIHEKRNLLWFLNVLKNEGDRARHDGSDVEIPVQQLNKECREVIALLLPELLTERQDAALTSTGPTQSSASQKRIDARVAVCERVGWDVYEELPTDLKEKLLQLSPDKKGVQLPPKDGMLFLLSQILESTLRNALKELPGNETPDLQEVLKTIEKQTECALPEKFGGTNLTYLHDALQGRMAVLKAYYLAYLYRCCKRAPETVPEAAQEQWAELIVWVDERRQHTAKSAFGMEYEELEKRRDEVFEFVKTVVRSE